VVGGVETGHIPANRVVFNRHTSIHGGDGMVASDVIKMVVKGKVQKHITGAGSGDWNDNMQHFITGCHILQFSYVSYQVAT